MDGIEVLKRVKGLSPSTEVVVITGYGTIQSAVSALRFGAYDYVEKPLNPDRLQNVVERALEHRKLLSENLRLRKEVSTLYSLENMVGSSRAMQKVLDLVSTVSRVDTTVLITGESGTGKELVARAIHYNSPRREKPFVVIDCVTIPETLIEAELFGHRKGAFTGAVSTERGLIEHAEGGSLFFDEIGNLPLSTQAKLLRVLQEKEFRPVGSRETLKADARFIAATNRDLASLVRKGEFREDLFYRLNVFPVHIPPLRERKEDMPALARHFLRKYGAETGRDVENISAEAMRVLITHDWPGNVREFENTIQRAILLSPEKTIRPEHIVITGGAQAEPPARTFGQLRETKRRTRENSQAEAEKAFVLDALKRNGWNATRAAMEVGMQRTNFHALMRKLGIKREQR
jgi:DNA-binding NtrC family response regulator